MKTYYGLIGAGGHGREVMPLLRSILNKQLPLGEVELLFVVEELTASEIVNGYKVISLIDFIDLPGEKKFNIAIGDSIVRARLAKICLDNKIEAFTICADSAVILDENEIGIGCMLSSFTTITSNVKIGKFFQANSYCNIAHDCVIGDYVTFAPGVKCNGNVHIGNHAYIGAGAVIKQGKKDCPTLIGEGAVIGMGAVVTRNVPPFTTVVGNPARPLEK